MKARKISYKGARQKGSNFERFVTKLLKTNHIDAVRVPMSGALSWLRGDIREMNTIHPHVHECKFQETLCLPDWWRQALAQVQEDEVPVLHFTSSYKPRMTVMRVDDFDDMVAAYQEQEGVIFLPYEMPARKNFWSYSESNHYGIFGVYQVQLEDEPVIIMTLDQYLMLRRAHRKQIAATILA